MGVDVHKAGDHIAAGGVAALAVKSPYLLHLRAETQGAVVELSVAQEYLAVFYQHFYHSRYLILVD